ncbi:50S ribosomal protein L31 [Mesomycoplasma hyopneumoniae]|uniref:50S ribosomal protein L31 n=6 Tax=Mesomycoplasma hyopneumoniae TaxID=2099 RepID=A0A223MB64_MESHO|nr:50S ribosomal protein L31 [Mesomycoplasma hyopneumoniae]AAV27580.1 50s ribosomal protein L31 [Mesomycoplasma hyopneumoniae 232]AAZ44539.1 50S ribosomal protein L31 [Mesomycoplasma hyopneumoniae J]AAZ53823.1 50S ribosomal protein L31 [Mesomycoplasma hyopneumoniae 7448]ADQ90664.1 50S ribosomal protein L31 [Mesomycoplasma hyopneumoniae 168]AGM22239.1 50S ribosomal protein L31 [Mesomycoplasma hyopneumoniae 168-L]
MKKNIHPVQRELLLSCSTCNSEFRIKSVIEKFTIDICSGCHPQFTGDRSLNRTTGRIERFRRMAAKAHKKTKK